MTDPENDFEVQDSKLQERIRQHRIDAANLMVRNNPELADAEWIVKWSEQQSAPADLPLLIRHLVLASSETEQCSIPTGLGIRQPGYDGVVVTSQPNPWIPNGTSFWEMGTGLEVRRKATDDFNKRSRSPGEATPNASTFVFVTSRRFPSKQQWVLDRRAEGAWSDVRVLDADDLEAWLTATPAVHSWFSSRTGLNPGTSINGETWWRSWIAKTDPPFPETLLLAGREDASTAVLSAISEPALNRPLFRSGSRQESIAFFLSVLASTDESLLVKTLVLKSQSSWELAIAYKDPLILIADFETPNAPEGIARGHRVLIPAGPQELAPNTYEVPQLDGRTAAKILKSSGFGDASDGSALLARRSLSAFMRRHAATPSLRRPSWAEGEFGNLLSSLLLVGSWDESNQTDRALVGQMSGNPYEEIAPSIIRLSQMEDAPLRKNGAVFAFASIEDAWEILGDYISRNQIEAYIGAARQVLFSGPPPFDFIGETGFGYGESVGHSPPARRAFAQTAALLGSRFPSTVFSNEQTGREVAFHAVRSALTPEDGAHASSPWIRLQEFLPLLAEACPEEFIRQLEALLQSGDASALFVDNESDWTPLAGRSPHTSLLWALETLAWYEEWFGEVVLLLAKLAQLDPGGRLANRPTSTLRHLFWILDPQTNADASNRQLALMRLKSLDPDVAFQVLRESVPRRGSHWTFTPRPVWKQFEKSKASVTAAEVGVQVEWTCKEMATLAREKPIRWLNLLPLVLEVTPEGRDLLLTSLQDENWLTVKGDDRFELWTAIAEFAQRHEENRERAWSLKGDALQPILAAAKKLEPLDAISKARAVFASGSALRETHNTDLGGVSKPSLDDLRSSAIRRVIDESGLPGIVELATTCDLPSYVGQYAAKLIDADKTMAVIFFGADRDSKSAQMAAGYIVRMYELQSHNWLNAFLSANAEYPADAIARVALAVAVDPIDLGLSEQVSREYWLAVHPWVAARYNAENATRKLIDVGRTWSAIEALELGLEDLEPQIVLGILKDISDTGNTEALSDARVSYSIGRVFDYLESDPRIDAEELVSLEWHFFPIARHDYPPKLLQRAVTGNPAFFAHIVSLLYKAKSEKREEKPTPEEDRVRAEAAFMLLRSEGLPAPGIDWSTGNIHPDVLQEFVRRSRSLLVELDRAKVGDIVLGELIAAAPPDADGTWPPEPICVLVEEIRNRDFENGIEIGVVNSRGITVRDPYEGGKQEWALARKYQSFAEVVLRTSPRTAAMLNRIASSYEADARREDAAARLLGDTY